MFAKLFKTFFTEKNNNKTIENTPEQNFMMVYDNLTTEEFVEGDEDEFLSEKWYNSDNQIIGDDISKWFS